MTEYVEARALIHELRQSLTRAVRALRDAEDLTRLHPEMWEKVGIAERVRSIYEQINEDIIEGNTHRPPLLERLATTEAMLMTAINALVAIRDHKEDFGSAPPDDEMRGLARQALTDLEVP